MNIYVSKNSWTLFNSVARLIKLLTKLINLYICLFHFLFVVSVFLFVYCYLVVSVSLRLVELDEQLLNLRSKLLFILAPLLVIFFVSMGNLSYLVLLYLHGSILVLLCCRKVEFMVLHITVFVLELCEFFLEKFVLVRFDNQFFF